MYPSYGWEAQANLDPDLGRNPVTEAMAKRMEIPRSRQVYFEAGIFHMLASQSSSCWIEFADIIRSFCDRTYGGKCPRWPQYRERR
jgi:hypothetical protein